MSKYMPLLYINNNISLKHVTGFVLNIFTTTLNVFKKKKKKHGGLSWWLSHKESA